MMMITTSIFLGDFIKEQLLNDTKKFFCIREKMSVYWI